VPGYTKLLISTVSNNPQQEVRWHAVQMLPRSNLSKLERKRIFGLQILHLEDRSRIVITTAMPVPAELAVQDD
jgi:hypothetical protein